MSKREPFSCVPSRAVFDPSLSATDLRVLLAIASYADGDGVAWPSQALLCDRLAVSRQTVSAAIKRLTGPYLVVSARTTPGRGKVGNQYRILMAAEHATSEGAQPMSNQRDIGSDPTSNQADIGSALHRKGRKAHKPKQEPMSPVVVIGEILPPEGGPMSTTDDIPYSEQHQYISNTELYPSTPSPCARASTAEWVARLEAAVALCGDVANRTGGGLASWSAFLPLCEPKNGEEPCDWDADVLPAIAAAAASMRAGRKLLRSWTLPSIAEGARANRDRRLAQLKAPTNDQRTHDDLFSNSGAASRLAAKRSGPGIVQPRSVGIDYARRLFEIEQREALAASAA